MAVVTINAIEATRLGAVQEVDQVSCRTWASARDTQARCPPGASLLASEVVHSVQPRD